MEQDYSPVEDMLAIEVRRIGLKTPPPVKAIIEQQESAPCDKVGESCDGEGQGTCCSKASCQATAPGSAIRKCIAMTLPPVSIEDAWVSPVVAVV